MKKIIIGIKNVPRYLKAEKKFRSDFNGASEADNATVSIGAYWVYKYSRFENRGYCKLCLKTYVVIGGSGGMNPHDLIISGSLKREYNQFTRLTYVKSAARNVV